MRSLTQPKVEDLDLAAVLHALGDPVRLELVRRMAADGEVSCSPEHLDIPRSTLSNHWRILREAGITSTRAEGKARYMTLRREDLEARFPGVLATILASTPAAAVGTASPNAEAPRGGGHVTGSRSQIRIEATSRVLW